MAPEETKGTRDPESEVQRRYQDVLALSRVSAALSGLSDLDAILAVALDNLLDVMNGEIGGILLLDEKTQTLAYRVQRGFSQSFAEGVRLSLGEGIIGQAAKTAKAILVEDISTDSRVALPALVSAEGLKAFVAVPLKAKDAVLGVINVASHEARRFTQSDVHLLHSVADQVSVAIEQAELYDRLRRARDRLRRLARLNLVVEEEERRRIARELHDETSQSLSGLALQLQALIERAATYPSIDSDFVAGLQKVHSLTVQVHQEISRLIGDLRPALLDTLGLVPAVRQHAESRLACLGINISVNVLGRVRRLPANVEVGLFRWVQGATGNIIKHSKAKNAEIIFEFGDDDLTILVRDDGVGFDVSKITDVEESGRGRGLFSMRERIGSLNGTGGIESQPGIGTNVWAKVPIAGS